MRWLLAVIAAGGLCAPLAHAQNVQTPAERLAFNQPSLAPTARLEAFAALMTDGPMMPALDMIAAAGVVDIVHLAENAATTVPEWAPRPTAMLEAQPMNLRLALTMLSQAYGADDVSDVLDAQPTPNRSALIIRKGSATMADLRRLLRETRLQQVAETGPLTLTVPLVIWSGASVQLKKGEVLNLSRTDGAFLMNFGLLQLDGVEIAEVGDTNVESPVFVPFVTTADGGVIQAQNTLFKGLGFGRTQKFSGMAIMQGTIRSPRQPSWIENSTFDSIMTVSVSMAHDVLLRGNHFSNMRGAALKVSRSMRAQIVLNIFSGRMRTNAIVLEDGSTGGRIVGNVVMGGKRAGIVVRNDSTGALVANNIVWRRKGGGIALVKSDCGVVTGNLVIDNDQKGVEVRGSVNVSVSQNAILDNHSAGLWVSDQSVDTTTFVRGNILAENGAGLSAAAGAAILMDENDFSHQYQQFLSGDLAPQTAHIARNMRGQAAIVLTAGGPLPPTQLDAVCEE
jgi:mannuronan 5-epimerase